MTMTLAHLQPPWDPDSAAIGAYTFWDGRAWQRQGWALGGHQPLIPCSRGHSCHALVERCPPVNRHSPLPKKTPGTPLHHFPHRLSCCSAVPTCSLPDSHMNHWGLGAGRPWYEHCRSDDGCCTCWWCSALRAGCTIALRTSSQYTDRQYMGFRGISAGCTSSAVGRAILTSPRPQPS
jgi:hypothetical protein